MSIIIGADFVPTHSNLEYFISGDMNNLLEDKLIDFLEHADFRVFNLELPLTDEELPILKYGPNLKAPILSVKGYKKTGVDLFTLANNHIMDYGEEGLNTTIKTLTENKISFLGAGTDLAHARVPYILNNGKKTGFYACCEHEFSIASRNHPGANPFDEIDSYQDVFQLKSRCDFVVVLYHGGKEHYRYPSPELQRRCRHLIESGADLVLCQHSHCIGCKEEFHNGTIVYGQGNFLFDRSESEFWKTGLLLKINHDFSIDYHPVIKDSNKVRFAEAEEADKILKEFYARSDEILKKEFVFQNYRKYAEKNIDDYLWILSGSGDSVVLRIINKLTGYKFCKWYLKRKYSMRAKSALINYFECEAHRELIICGLKNKKV